MATRTGYPAWEDTPPTVWRRPWDKVYCCPTAAKSPVERAVHSTFLQYLQVKSRADERTRTADLLITSELLYLLSYVGLLRPVSISQGVRGVILLLDQGPAASCPRLTSSTL